MLVSLIKRLESEKTPIAVKEEKNSNLLVEIKVVDAKWLSIMGPSWKNKTYTAYLDIDEYKKEVRLFDIIKEVGFDAGKFEFSQEKYFTSGMLIDTKQQARMLGIRPDMSLGEVYKYKFDPETVRSMIKEICNEHGWDFKRVLFR